MALLRMSAGMSDGAIPRSSPSKAASTSISLPAISTVAARPCVLIYAPADRAIPTGAGQSTRADRWQGRIPTKLAIRCPIRDDLAASFPPALCRHPAGSQTCGAVNFLPRRASFDRAKRHLPDHIPFSSGFNCAAHPIAAGIQRPLLCNRLAKAMQQHIEPSPSARIVLSQQCASLACQAAGSVRLTCGRQRLKAG